MSRATRCCVKICAALAFAPLIILLAIGDSLAAEPAAGSVTDALGRPVTNALVMLRAADGRTVLRTTSGEHGRFKLRAQLPGTYELIVQKPGFKPASEILVFPATARTPL